MIIKEITYYLQGKLSEEESNELWLHLLNNPDDLELLQIYWMYRKMYSSSNSSTQIKSTELGLESTQSPITGFYRLKN